MAQLVPRGLYVITDPELTPGDAMIQAVEAALAGGAVMVQYRDKHTGAEARRRQASALLDLCRQYEAPLIVNDDLALAALVGADGVHLGRHDRSVTTARQNLGAKTIIGASCYDSLELARRAQAAGADYIAFGSFFPSTVKPDAVQPDLALLERARAELEIPIAAIGGITPENGGALVNAGAHLLAVITGVFGQQDIGAAAARFAGLFHQPAQTRNERS